MTVFVLQGHIYDTYISKALNDEHDQNLNLSHTIYSMSSVFWLMV